MDQSASILSHKGKALNIEFVPELSSRPVDLPSGVVFVICNCLKRKEKAVDASQYYNKRVVECRLAALCIAKEKGMDLSSVSTLRDVVDLTVAAAAERDQPGEYLHERKRVGAKSDFLKLVAHSFFTLARAKLPWRPPCHHWPSTAGARRARTAPSRRLRRALGLPRLASSTLTFLIGRLKFRLF